MTTLASSIKNAFNAMDQIEQLTNIKDLTPEQLEDLRVSDITKALQDLTNGDGAIVENADIAKIVEGAFDSIASEESVPDSILNKPLDENDANSKTIAQTIVDNIATNENLDWTNEGAVIEDIAKKAIELTNNEQGSSTEDLVDELQGLLDNLYETDEDGEIITDKDGNKISKSDIITPDLIEYFKSYLATNFGSSN